MVESEEVKDSFYRRSKRAAIWLGLLISAFIVVYGGGRRGLLFFSGYFWIMVNFMIWEQSIPEILIHRRSTRVFLWLLVKSAWLACLLLIAWLLQIGRSFSDFVFFLLGLNLPFIVLLLKAGGKMITKKTAE